MRVSLGGKYALFFLSKLKVKLSSPRRGSEGYSESLIDLDIHRQFLQSRKERRHHIMRCTMW